MLRFPFFTAPPTRGVAPVQRGYGNADTGYAGDRAASAVNTTCRPLTVPPAYIRRCRASRLLTSGAVAPHACLLCRLIFDLPINSLLTRYASVTAPVAP